MKAEMTEAEYRYWYNRGWRYSGSGSDSVSLDWGDHNGFPEAWYDGYLDLAAGREKWHLLGCRKSGGEGCAEHDDGSLTMENAR